MKNKAFVFFLCIAAFGCTKKSGVNVVLSGNLTNCAANSTCTYDYFDNADFKDWYNPVHGDFRVFWYKSVNTNLCDATSEFYFKTSLSNDDFDITSGEIASGQVFANNLVCPCCDIANLIKPIGGEIKGKRTDASHWLVNATVIMGTAINKPVDTLVVNQYFTIKSL